MRTSISDLSVFKLRRWGFHDPAYLDTLSPRALLPDKESPIEYGGEGLACVCSIILRASDDAKACGDVFEIERELRRRRSLRSGVELHGKWNIARISAATFTSRAEHGGTEKSLSHCLRVEPPVFYRERAFEVLLAAHRRGLFVGSGKRRRGLFKLFSTAHRRKKRRASLKVRLSSNRAVDVNTQLLDVSWSKAKRTSVGSISIYELQESLGKPVVATGNVKYMDVGDFTIGISSLRAGKRRRNDTGVLFDNGRMLEEFQYLGTKSGRGRHSKSSSNYRHDERRCTADSQRNLSAEDHELRRKASGSNLREREPFIPTLFPDSEKRLDWAELDHCQRYAVLYMIARDLLLKSNEDGYLVGSEVPSALLCGDDGGDYEVNPLPPPLCYEGCRHSEFSEQLVQPASTCRIALSRLRQADEKDEFDIPFEGFLGFDGDKRRTST